MKRTIPIALSVLLMLLSACMLPPAAPPDWQMQKEGIVLNLKADRRLNESKGTAYTLYVVVYQLINPNTFNRMIDDQDGLTRLLESRIFDASVASVKSMILYPGSDVTYRMDRAEGAMYVGIVAGYHVMAKERMARLFHIPVDVKFTNILNLSRKLVPSKLEINLTLGPQQIDDTKEEK
ncbi:type VI secretion system lipoprotein TssJ [Desulfatiferula olefinivorans]